jgi:hypothetical protein
MNRMASNFLDPNGEGGSQIKCRHISTPFPLKTLGEQPDMNTLPGRSPILFSSPDRKPDTAILFRTLSIPQPMQVR